LNHHDFARRHGFTPPLTPLYLNTPPQLLLNVNIQETFAADEKRAAARRAASASKFIARDAETEEKLARASGGGGTVEAKEYDKKAAKLEDRIKERQRLAEESLKKKIHKSPFRPIRKHPGAPGVIFVSQLDIKLHR
jgi:hypothetical protein